MSDSQREEKDRKDRQNKADFRTEENPRSQLPWPLLILAGLALCAFVVFGWNIGTRLLNNTDKRSEARLAPAENGEKADGESALDGPLSILPEMPEGTTIIEKQPEGGAAVNGFAAAPVAQGADSATGFAVDLGKGVSFLELSKRFANIVNENGPENFQRLEPRAILIDTVAGLEARLLVGPFDTEKAASEACEVLILPEDIDCSPTSFEGELIARQ